MGTGLVVHNNIFSSLKRMEFVSDALSYVMDYKMMEQDCHASTGDKEDVLKEFYTKQENLYDYFAKCDI